MRPTQLHSLIVVALLSGCGSDDDSPPVNAATVPLNEYGVIRLNHDTNTTQTKLDAVFCALDNPTAAATVDAQFLTGLDSCTVSNDGSTDNDITAPLACSTELSGSSISAGSNLTVSSSAGTFADMAQQVTDEVTTYTVTSPLPRPPNGLTVSIPGDVFPQFSAAPIPDLQEPVINTPAAGELLRGSTEITWTAANDDTDSRLILTASDANVTVNCSLKDDGSYTFSAATQAELGELFAANSVSIRRQNLTSPTRGDSGLVIITSIQ